MFVQITDPDKAWELFQVGLLWESSRGFPPCPAWGWDSAGHMRVCRGSFRFYILLEE